MRSSGALKLRTCVAYVLHRCDVVERLYCGAGAPARGYYIPSWLCM